MKVIARPTDRFRFPLVVEAAIHRARVVSRLGALSLTLSLTFFHVGSGIAAAQYRPSLKKYDHQGRLVAAADERGELWTFVYEADGSREVWFGGYKIALEKADGTVEAYAYDAHGRRIQTRITRKDGAPRYIDRTSRRPLNTSTFVEAPRLLAADGRGAGPDASGAAYARDERGRITSVTNRRGTTRYRYFEDVDAPLIAEVVSPDGSTEHFDIEAARAAYEALVTPSTSLRASTASSLVPTGLCAASGNRFAFGGYQYECELGLYFTPSGRMYDPQVGRFTSQDSYLGKVDDPPSLHRYLYANANPVRYVDPTGHQTIGSDYCRAFSCSPSVQNAVGLSGQARAAFNESLAAAEEKERFVIVTAATYAWNSTLGNPGHNARPEVLVPLPQPKNDTEAWLGAATILAVDLAPAVVRSARIGEPPSSRLAAPRDPALPGDLPSPSRFPTAPLPGTSLAQTEAAARSGFLEGVVLDSDAQRSSSSRAGGTQGVPGGNAPPSSGSGTGPVRWVDESATMSPQARNYQAGATGARSSVPTSSPQAPELSYTDANGLAKTVRFDGSEGNVLIDRKVSVTNYPKSQSQALRQSQALEQNGLRGRWEVPTAVEAARAQRMFQKLGIENIDVKIVKP